MQLSINMQLKELMLSYESGHISFDDYRRERSSLVDTFTGEEKTIPITEVEIPLLEEFGNERKLFPYFAIGTFLLLIISAVIFYSLSSSDTPGSTGKAPLQSQAIQEKET